MVAEACASGKGVPRDIEKSLKYYRLAAEQDHPAAQFRLARLHRLGERVPQDKEMGIKRLKRAQGPRQILDMLNAGRGARSPGRPL